MKAGFFPGQGSQSVGMGREFYDEFTVFRQVIEEASDTLRFDVKTLLFEGPEDELTLTQNAQPAILSVSTGCFRVAETELDLKPDVVLGHSLGEYSALVASEAISFSDAVAWVHERGSAMQKAVPVGAGAMAAILGASDADVEEWCEMASKKAGHDYRVEPANYNSPGQVVVSGATEAVDALEALVPEEATKKGLRRIMVKRLNVSAPFHCSMMKPARDVMDQIFKTALEEKKINDLIIPYIPNRTAKISTDAHQITPLLSEQVDHSVLWKQSVDTLIQNHCSLGFEFGPGKVLQGLGKRIAKERGVELEIHPIYDLESLKAAQKLKK